MPVLLGRDGRMRRYSSPMPDARPVRVLYVQGATERAGAEAVLLARLPHLAGAGVEPVVLSLVDGPFVGELRGLEIPVETLSPTTPRVRDAARFLGVIRDVAATARRLGIDVIDGWGEKMSVISGWAARRAGCAAVMTLHDAPRRSAAATVVQLAAIAARHDAVVVPSQWMASEFHRAWRIHPRVIPNGLAIESLPKLAAPIRRRLGWPRDAPVAGIFGRLVGWKGQSVFLRAARAVLDREPDARFLVVGGTLYGWEAGYADELRRSAAALGIADRVHFTGHRDDRLELMLACDVVCHASLESEPFGLVVAEAMALERAVVATRTRGPEEIIEAGRTGLLVPAGDDRALATSVGDLFASPDRRRRIGAAAGAAARSRFDSAHVTAAVAELYHELERRRLRMR